MAGTSIRGISECKLAESCTGSRPETQIQGLQEGQQVSQRASSPLCQMLSLSFIYFFGCMHKWQHVFVFLCPSYVMEQWVTDSLMLSPTTEFRYTLLNSVKFLAVEDSMSFLENKDCILCPPQMPKIKVLTIKYWLHQYSFNSTFLLCGRNYQRSVPVKP